MVPHAIFLDLDETLIDRTQSITQYAERFYRDFADALAPLAVPTIAATILTADEWGYRPREALFQDLLQQLPWQTPPAVVHLHTHWETWFPVASVVRVGLQETVHALYMQGIRLRMITNGVVQRQQPKIVQLPIQPYLSTVLISEEV